MAYSKEEAHEYYEKYRKHGLKKGRKKTKSKAKAKKLVSVRGITTSGLNDSGVAQAKLAKEQLTQEMNVALNKAKTKEEKAQVKAEYKKKAQDLIKELKNNPQYAKQKAAKAKASGSSSKSGSEKEKASSNSKTTKAKTKVDKRAIEELKDQLINLHMLANNMEAEQKERVVKMMQKILDTLKKMKAVSKQEKEAYQKFLEK